jgi:hypothetical protein
MDSLKTWRQNQQGLDFFVLVLFFL